MKMSQIHCSYTHYFHGSMFVSTSFGCHVIKMEIVLSSNYCFILTHTRMFVCVWEGLQQSINLILNKKIRKTSGVRCCRRPVLIPSSHFIGWPTCLSSYLTTCAHSACPLIPQGWLDTLLFVKANSELVVHE